MKHLRWITNSRQTLLGLAVLLIGTPVFALGPGAGDSDSDSDSDESIFVRKTVRLEDCPEVKVLGAGGARVISRSPRTFLGVEASHLTPELRAHFGVPEDAGVMLSKIVDDSAAEAAGLVVGDIVTRVNGDEISSASRLGHAVRQREDGDAVEIEYWRDGEMYQTTGTLKARERCSVDIGDHLRALRVEDLPELGEIGIEIGGEALATTLETLRQTFAGKEWDFEFEGLSESEMERIEERMEHVQERMERLEERLEREFGREFERAERGLARSERERARELERTEREAARALEQAERERERAERERERAERERAKADGEDGEGVPI
ncbi:MAG: PDZ domain-containing protein [bacterium]|nr:PDZ domain-containing protein [bacterium]